MSKELIEWREKHLNSISPSFCAAKWYNASIHLGHGYTGSCHLPLPHPIDVEEIKTEPSAIHNTKHKKQMRKMMLEGVKPAECSYCWKIEGIGRDNVSDRIYKSQIYNTDDIQKLKDSQWDAPVSLKTLEISFDRQCNFACSYCNAAYSTTWAKDLEEHGAYQNFKAPGGGGGAYQGDGSWAEITGKKMDSNPYVEAFLKWWPTMYQSLQHFRITGGEPLLSKNTFKVLDYIIENPNPNLEFSINSNMNPPDKVFDLFIEKIKIIVNEKKVKSFKIFTSAEAHGKQSEYIRHGMDYNKWLDNIHRVYREIPDIEFTIMSTYNILSLTSYIPFLKDVLEIKRTYGKHDDGRNPMLLDIPYLRYPDHQAIFIMEPEWLEMIYDHVTFMYQNLEYKEWYGTANRSFYEHEADKLKRIYNIAKNAGENEWTNINRKNFALFVDEHDRRRGTNFSETFPELVSAYTKWKRL